MSLITDIEDNIKEHLKHQPYSIKCSKCGEELNVYDLVIDDDLDIRLDVDPCINHCGDLL